MNQHKVKRGQATLVSAEAYKDGYNQVKITQYLGLSKFHVSKVLKEVDI
jgi:DNA-directed RNA polymerase specialized sigma subunit